MKKKYLLALLAGLLCLLCLLCAEASASEEEHKGHSTIYYYNYSAKSHQLYCTTCQKIVSFGFCSGASATCTKPGYCETCLNPYRLPTGHKMTNYESDNNATCTQDGTKTARCQNDGCGESKTIPDEGSKLGHNFINYTPNGDANCTSVGTRTATCSRCTATDTQPGEGEWQCSGGGEMLGDYVTFQPDGRAATSGLPLERMKTLSPQEREEYGEPVWEGYQVYKSTARERANFWNECAHILVFRDDTGYISGFYGLMLDTDEEGREAFSVLFGEGGGGYTRYDGDGGEGVNG